MASKLASLKVDKGHSYVIIGYSEYPHWPNNDEFENNIKEIGVRNHLGNGGQGDPGKGGLGTNLKELKPIASAALAALNTAKKSAGHKSTTKINIDAPFKHGRAEIKPPIDARYYGAIEFPTLGTARYWLKSHVGKDFIKAYDVVFIQATMGCPLKDADGL